jgi:hypothetical protein
MKPLDTKLYEKVKKEIYIRIPKHSAYRSANVVREYKKRGGKFINDGKERTLSRWFQEKWKDVNPNKTKTSYPVYRPTVRVSRKTPLTLKEIDKKDLLEQSRRKQIIKGSRNLRPFKKSISSRSIVRKSVKAKPKAKVKKSRKSIVRKSIVRKSIVRKSIVRKSVKAKVKKSRY